jgi:hypothetical protein
MDIFNRANIYNTIFFNIQSVTEYGDVSDFEKAEPEKYRTWLYMAKKRYSDEFEKIDADANLFHRITNDLYLEKACFLPEFSKIIGITYGTVESVNDELKRTIKRINGETEPELIIEFINVLNQKYSDGHNSQPKMIPTLCGHNLIGHDIPLLVKRIIKYREPLIETGSLHIIPPIIKDFLKSKPWDENVLDTVNAWKFNGTDYISLQLIADFMGLKYRSRLLPKEEINKLYWTDIEDDEGSIIEKIRAQSADQVNLTIQLIRDLGKL